MSRVVRFADGKDFKPKPPTPGGKKGRKCPRWPKEVKAAALGCAVAIAGTEESLERDRGWAVRGLNQRSLAKAVDQVLPAAIKTHMDKHSLVRLAAEASLFNRLYRMYNTERKAAPKGAPDDWRGGRSAEHLFNWKDKAKYMGIYERALQFGTRERRTA